MGQDFEGGGRDTTDETMIQRTQSDEVVKDVTDIPITNKMGDGMNISKMENVKNSTKNGHNS